MEFSYLVKGGRWLPTAIGIVLPGGGKLMDSLQILKSQEQINMQLVPANRILIVSQSYLRIYTISELRWGLVAFTDPQGTRLTQCIQRGISRVVIPIERASPPSVSTLLELAREESAAVCPGLHKTFIGKMTLPSLH